MVRPAYRPLWRTSTLPMTHTIKFTTIWSTKEVTFLDTRVHLDRGQLETDLHVKPIDTHQYLCPAVVTPGT